MSIIRKFALVMLEDELEWPEGVAYAQQNSSYEVYFYNENNKQVSAGRYGYLEITGLPYMEEYDEDGEKITKEEFEAFMLEHPNLQEEIATLQRENTEKISVLNKQIAVLVNEVMKLADEACIDVTLNLGTVGHLSPNSDWDSSRC